jgi:hypothetical protein
VIDNRKRVRKAGKWHIQSQSYSANLSYLDTYIDAPPLPLPDGSAPPQKNSKQDMEDFLDDLLT